MARKLQFIFALFVLSNVIHAQDSLSSKPVPAKSAKQKIDRPHEVGVSISSVFFMLAGVSDFTERYTNVTYRHFFKQRQAFKAFAGVNIFNANNTFDQNLVSSVNNTTIYATREKDTPSNFQVGLGYEYVLGNGKLKHVMGADILYNNKFERERFYYDRVSDGPNQSFSYARLDTGSYTKAVNYDKIGVNLSYNLRYQLSKRWVITAGMLISYKTYRRKEKNGYSNNSETNFNGLISDISVFYRF